MRRFALALAAIVVMAATVVIPASSQGLRQSRVGQFWGTFVHWAEFGPQLKYTTPVTISVDGTFVAGGSPPVQGVWEKTGPRTVQFTGLLQRFDAGGNLAGLERHRCYFEFSRDFESYTGMEFAETVSCPSPVTCPNPLDPSVKWTVASWTPPTGIPVSGARLEVVAPGPLQ